MTKLMFFSGSSQENSVNSRLAQAAAELVEALDSTNIFVTQVHLKDFDVPVFDGETVPFPERAEKFKILLREHDGLFLGADEYTGAYSAILRNLIGWLSVENGSENTAFKNKPVVVCGASSRGIGSVRGQPALKQLLASLGAKIIYQHIRLGTAATAFQANGELTESVRVQLLETAIPKLLTASKQGAAKINSC